LSRTEHRDAPINDKVAPAQIAAVGQWGTDPGERFAHLMNIQQPTLVVSGNHDVIVHTVNSLYLVQNMPNAKLILYPDANHGLWYENHEDCALEANWFPNDSDSITAVTTSAAAEGCSDVGSVEARERSSNFAAVRSEESKRDGGVILGPMSRSPPACNERSERQPEEQMQVRPQRRAVDVM